MSAPRFDFIVVGAGFAGSILAMIARQQGFSVALVERGRHPRFAIGESSTPLANLLLEEIDDEFDLPFLKSFSKWGAWQKEHPEIGCGLKRGFTFYHHRLGEPFPSDPDLARQRQFLVGASPADAVADTHWYRPDFDHYLVQQAERHGVVYFDETALETFSEEESGVRVTGTRGARPIELHAKFLFDASGPRGFLHRALQLPEADLNYFPKTQALYAHFSGVKPLSENFISPHAPYPPERAAVHHVFDGGWLWVLQFNNGLTSAGVAATDTVADRFNFRSGAAAWQNLLAQLPSLQESFQTARAITPFVWQPRVAFQSAEVAGKNWALLPSAAGAIDPLLSTGFPLTLLGVQRLGRLLKFFHQHAFASGLDDYAVSTREEFTTTARLVSGLYSKMACFDDFAELSLLYFTAASYSESARRLGKFSLAKKFLLSDRPEFANLIRTFSESSAVDTRKKIRTAIEPFDVAGLSNVFRHPWYPAQMSDLIANASKLKATPSQVGALLQKLGLPQKTIFSI